ncbi:hypothetical protein VTJ04DRAFT_7298 [Mycothermus thermophilus]|uniref:uncharacterized protein n=1 Tax=Humicola insolens TaxID=85995 RepID=UPI0037442BA5
MHTPRHQLRPMVANKKQRNKQPHQHAEYLRCPIRSDARRQEKRLRSGRKIRKEIEEEEDGDDDSQVMNDNPNNPTERDSRMCKRRDK